MNPVELTLTISVADPCETTVILKKVPPDQTVAEVLQEVLRRLGLPAGEPGWCLYHQGAVLPPGVALCSCLPLSQEPIELVLRKEAATGLPCAADESVAFELCLSESVEALSESVEAQPAAPVPGEDDGKVKARARALTAAPVPEEDEAVDLALDDAPLSGAEAVGPVPQPTAPEKAMVNRQATVRYYNRMNPERVYPLLVIITRKMVEKVAKKGVEQRSSGLFEVDADAPVEIEPVLPGCDCHPPKVVSRLSAGDLTVTFRVVPRVLGKVDGATVSIRQDHVSLAEIGLEMKVTKRTWVALSGVLTFLLPGLSAILKHFGLEFESQGESGFSLYLSAARLVFDKVSPLGLTAVGGLITGLLWWMTKPRTRDTFWDIEKVGPGELLQRVATAAKSDPEQAARDLMELLRAFPDHQPALLYYAEWHYKEKSYEAALKGYERAFKLCTSGATHYYRAALCASRLEQNKRALGLLQDAERLLPPDQMTGAMLYNMGCYHVRLGNHEAAMTSLKRAVQAGYRKLESYLKDPDLGALRSRADFKQLIADLQSSATFNVRCPRCRQPLILRHEHAGLPLKCPACSGIFQAPQ